MGIRFACMIADFQNPVFLEYLVFFGAVFFAERQKMICRIDYDMFFGILIFELK